MRAGRALALVLLPLACGCSVIDDFGKFAAASPDLAAPEPADLEGTPPPDLAATMPRDLSSLIPPDLAAPVDAPLIDAGPPDLLCVPGCVNKNTLTTCKGPATNCAAGCVAAGGGLDAHCALAPTGGDLCAGGFAPATTIPVGKYYLDADQNAPRIRSVMQGGPSFTGALVQNHAVFCFTSLTQDQGWVIIDASNPGHPANLPLAIVTQNEFDMPSLVLWVAGADGLTPNGSGLGRNGAGSGGVASSDAMGGGGAGSTGGNIAITAGGGGGGGNVVKGGVGGIGAGNGGGLGGKGAPTQVGLVGGSGGGGGGDKVSGGAGGAGGGVLQISAGSSLRLGGALYAMGGRGAHGEPGAVPGGGGGGGGGGNVLLESPIIEYIGMSCAMVSGGWGGGGAGTTKGSGGSFQLPLAALCPLMPGGSVGGNNGGGSGGDPGVMVPNQELKGGVGSASASGGGGAGGAGAFRQRALKVVGAMTVFPSSPATNISEPY